MIIKDAFIYEYDKLKKYADGASFFSVQNPIDGAVYPLICIDIPEYLKNVILFKITELMGFEPTSTTMFMRRSPKGVPVPHIAHHDLSMGKYSLMLYLNDHEEGGTAFIRHKDTGMAYAPEHDDFVSIAQFDQNNPEKWAIIEQAKMKQNRAVIFDAGLFHCAMPIGGFGEGSEARTVLTCFFSD